MKIDELIKAVTNKRVNIVTHWDCDGVTSAALIYHMILPYAKEIHTHSKGDVFLVKKEDLHGDPDIIFSIDIQPSLELDPEKIIYIDHHPHPNPELFKMSIHDPSIQSTSVLIWRELIPETKDPYFLFLVITGYIGDGGDIDNLSPFLFKQAVEFIPELLKKRPSSFGKGYYYEIERYVSSLNAGKRMHWSGDIPLEMLKNIKHHSLFINNIHPIANELDQYKLALRDMYKMSINLHEFEHLNYAVIESDRNIQGVLCARHMKNKPIVILNKFKGNVIASMRVPDEMDFDAGRYLSKFSDNVESFIGGGHEKAAGFTILEKDLPQVLDLLKSIKNC